MQVTIKIDTDLMKRLANLVNDDLDNADQTALKQIWWQLAEKAGLCDENGNAV